MKILTWNVARPDIKKSQSILEIINSYNTDIVVLTETNSRINLDGDYKFVATKALAKNYDDIEYKIGENRTTIFTKYKILNQFETFDNHTSINIEIETEFGNLTVYGTIIGVFGGKNERFNQELEQQLVDFNHFKAENLNCIIGDLNTTFSGYTYPSHRARNLLNEVFNQKNMLNLTQDLDNNVDHIVISKNLLENKKTELIKFNLDKKLSDHIGIFIEIT
jgi:endonuclease/exonuclease/phosphatase family metal-dependent hydrolase